MFGPFLGTGYANVSKLSTSSQTPVIGSRSALRNISHKWPYTPVDNVPRLTLFAYIAQQGGALSVWTKFGKNASTGVDA